MSVQTRSLKIVSLIITRCTYRACLCLHFAGDIKLLTSDMQALQPTMFPTVPRLLNRIHDTVRANVKDSRIKEFIFNLALSRKQAAVKNGVFQRDTIWDYIGMFALLLIVTKPIILG